MMIPKTKYEDKAFMLSELCQFFKSDELPQLDMIAASCPETMSKKEFDYLYTQHLKLIYLRAMTEGEKYERVPFETLHSKIMSAVKKDPKCRDKFKTEQNSDTANVPSKNKILEHIANIKNSQKQ